MAEHRALEVHSDIRSGCRVVRPVGVLDVLTYAPLRDALVKLALDQPRALIVDLDDLHVAGEAALTVFSTTWMRVSEWPGIPIMLVATAESQRALLRGAISRFTPCYASVGAALAAADLPQLRRRANLDLAADAVSSRVARAFVRETCREWGVPERIPDALVVATELVDNVALHTGLESQIRLELRRGTLTVAVRDGSAHPAVLRERIGAERRGNGLRIVAGIARVWGCTSDSAGGKVVWAVLRGGRV